MVSSDGKNSKQVETAVSKTNRAFGRMRKTFKFFNIKLFNILYPAFVRAHLEFASAVWNSMSKKDISKLEGIQKRATRMVIELKGLEYEKRLKELGLTNVFILVNAPMRDNFLLNRNATTWNMLPSEIAEADTVNQFKARIDRHMASETWRRSVYRS